MLSKQSETGLCSGASRQQRKEREVVGSSQALLDLAEAAGPAWEAFADACYGRADRGNVVVESVSKPLEQLETGQRIRTFAATIQHDSLGRADIQFHLGVAGDMIYTGYEEEELYDYYQMAQLNGQQYEGSLYNPEAEEDEPETAMSKAWYATAPLRTILCWAICARLLDGRELVG